MQKIRLKQAIVALAVVGATAISIGAQAATAPTATPDYSYTITSFPYNNLADSDIRTGAPPPGSFVDFYDFTISSNNDVGSNAIELELYLGADPTYDISGLQANLWGSPDNGSTWPSDPISSAIGYQGILADGLYRIVVEGNAIGSAGGLYTLAVTAVPVPPAVLLFGAGLVGLAAVARRRNNAAGTQPTAA
jgi:hypothetical protein